MELEQQFSFVFKLINQAKLQAYQAVNKELVNLYWQIGEYVSQQVETKVWGISVVKELANFIGKTEPNLKGFSSQNIWRMKQFYETYKDNEKLSALTREISWTHNTIIFSSCKATEERTFYTRMSIKEKWSSRELQRQITTSTFERVMLADSKLSALTRVLPQDISKTFKDSYVLELLQLPNPFANFSGRIPNTNAQQKSAASQMGRNFKQHNS